MRPALTPPPFTASISPSPERPGNPNAASLRILSDPPPARFDTFIFIMRADSAISVEAEARWAEKCDTAAGPKEDKKYRTTIYYQLLTLPSTALYLCARIDHPLISHSRTRLRSPRFDEFFHQIS
jgi:hypothetical protein